MSRRLVSVLFLDLVGWTGLAERLDPEPLQQLLEGYYELCVAAVERHDGSIEKYIGDAIMATFGAERSHEDDALRAVRTASLIRDQVGQLLSGKDTPLQVHCGIAAGEALVTHSPRAGLRVVGDVVNLAARLQSVAPAGEIFVNEVVVRLVRSRYTMAPIPPLTLKGKRDPVAAWRVAAESSEDAAGQWSGAPFVNRLTERDHLQTAYDEVRRSRRMRVLTVLGVPGIGKSRLVNEAVGELVSDERPRIAFGTCSSYGSETYGALSQLLDPLLAESLPSNGGLSPRVPEVLSYLPGGPVVSDGQPPPGVEEISWAVRELLRFHASRPLVLVWDDLHWASPSLLNLIGEVADGLRDCPVLMICVASLELRAQQPAWLRSAARASTLELGQLARPETIELVAALSAAQAGAADVVAHDTELLERVATESAGNPLFAELMVETVAAGYPLDQAPPSVTAMTGALIDRLSTASRELIEAASVVGPSFTMEQVALLGNAAARSSLTELVDRQLLRPGSRPGEYHFVRQMVHGVVYGRLSKRQRLAWHQELARQGVDPAFHLEAGVHLLLDLQPDAPALGELSQAAAQALLREGTEALRRRDLPAAIGLLARAREVAHHGDAESQIVATVRLSDALLLSSELSEALAVVTEPADGAPRQPGLDRASYPRADLLRAIQRHLLTLRANQSCQVPLTQLSEQLRQLPPDPLGWCRFHQLQMLVKIAAGQFQRAEAATGQALAYARQLPDSYEQDRILAARCEIGQWSPSPIAGKLADCRQLAQRFAGDRYLLVPVLVAQARFLALTGEFPGARAVLAEANTAAEELRLTMGGVLVAQVSALTWALAGDPQAAEAHYRAAVATLEAAGHRPAALTLQVLAARERLGSHPAAEVAPELWGLAEQLDQLDQRGQALCWASLAQVAAATGGEVTELASKARRATAATDDACLHADVHSDLARAYRTLGDPARARKSAELAVAAYATVGATYPMRTVRQWI